MTKPKNPRTLPVQDIVNPTQRKSLGLGEYTGPRERAPNEALPRTPVPSIGIKTLENHDTYYRNAGNKHIKSTGDRC